MSCRAYPGSEFVVANTFAKWKKLEPNEIDYSQGFSQNVVSRSCFVFNSLLASGNFCHLLLTFANSLDPDQAPKNVGPDLDPNCMTPWWYWKRSSIQRVKYGTLIKSEGIIHVKAILENPKADQNTLFRKYVIFEPLANDFYLYPLFIYSSKWLQWLMAGWALNCWITWVTH